MLELSIRLIAAGLIFVSSAWFGAPDASTGWKLALGIGVYAAIGFALETRGKRNQGVVGILSVCDAGAILFFGASLHGLDAASILSLLPVLYVFKRFQVNLWLTVPCVVGLLFAASASFYGPDINPGIYFESLAALVLPVIFKLPEEQPASAARPALLPTNSELGIAPDSFFVLRENFRKMKDRCKEIEVAAKRDHMLAQLHTCRLAPTQNFHAKLSEAICSLSGAQSAALYTLSQFGETMVVRGTHGPVQSAIEDSSYSVNLAQAARQITDHVELTTRAMLVEEERAKVSSVLLTHDNRVIGMINLFHSDWDDLFEAKRQVESASQTISWIIMETQRKAGQEKRLKELELLYETAVVSTGATDRKELVERVSRRLGAIVEADFIGAYLIESGEPVLVGSSGNEMPFLESMSFSGGSGFGGWIAAGAPELAVFQPRDDQRCRAEEFLRKRIGSFILVPLQFDEQPFGFIAGVARASNRLDSSDLAALRAVSAECAQAVCRMEHPTPIAGGLVTPAAFQRTLSSARTGCIVYFELLKKQQLLENCDARAIEEGLREFSYRLRGKLTAGGAACQKGVGGFIVFLPNASTNFVSSWANDVAATASMIGVRTSGGKTTIPLAFRARVANLAPQSNEELAAQPA
jgi:hypothetical protein